jgi:DNA-binding SARP family transcriptional activator
MGPAPITRIQLCGQFAVVCGSDRIEDRLPGRLGRLLVAYLAVHRRQQCTREQIIAAFWPDGSAAASATLTVLLSRVRSVLGHEAVEGRTSLRLVLGDGAVVDTELAVVGLHQAESALALQAYRRAWGHSLTGLFATSRPFLSEFEASWIDEERDRYQLVRQRAIACYVQACLGIGGTELPAAERAARELISIAPMSETGHRLLMLAQSAAGDSAAALLTYEKLRRSLSDELGVDPDPQTRAVYEKLLGLRPPKS